MELPSDSLLVAVADHRALIRVLGRGSFKGSPALKRFGQAAIQKGCSEFILDMEGCVGMDSTFMGVLAGLAMRLKREKSGRMALVNLSVKNHRLLKQLGLDQLLTMQAAGAGDGGVPAEGLSMLDTAPTDKRVTAETMLAAHEDLIQLSPDNLPKFKDVLAYIREDLKSAGGSEERRK